MGRRLNVPQNSPPYGTKAAGVDFKVAGDFLFHIILLCRYYIIMSVLFTLDNGLIYRTIISIILPLKVINSPKRINKRINNQITGTSNNSISRSAGSFFRLLLVEKNFPRQNAESKRLFEVPLNKQTNKQTVGDISSFH